MLAFLLRSYHLVYMVRPERHLVFWMCLALFSVGLKNRTLAAIGCGLSAGMLINIKIHASFTYFLRWVCFTRSAGCAP